MNDPRLFFDGSLALSPGCVTYVGPGGVAERHAHHAVQLVVARDAPFKLALDGGAFEARVALVPAGVEHALDAGGKHVAILLFERHGPSGRALERLARDGLSERHLSDVLAEPFPSVERAASAARSWSKILVGDAPPTMLTREVRSAIAELGRRIGAREDHALADVARTVGLSPTRLTHRFSAEVGIPFRAFVPWLRIARAVREVQASRATGLPPNLTRAALAAGFVDSGHLTRTFRALFGMPPSLVLSMAQLSGFDDHAA